MIDIQKMEIDHLNMVESIERELFSSPWSYEMYKVEISKDYSHQYVVLNDDQVIGYFGFFKTDENEAEVTNIAVKSDFQGMGIGNIIMKNLIDYAISFGIDKIFLEVRQSNVRAKSLYEKFNFNKINVRKKYYEGIEDACIYMWER